MIRVRTASAPDTRILYTVAEAAKSLLVTEDWLIKQLRARKLPGRKVGRTWRMAPADIEAAPGNHLGSRAISPCACSAECRSISRMNSAGSAS